MESGSVTIIRSVARVFKVHVFLVPSSLLVDYIVEETWCLEEKHFPLLLNLNDDRCCTMESGSVTLMRMSQRCSKFMWFCLRVPSSLFGETSWAKREFLVPVSYLRNLHISGCLSSKMYIEWPLSCYPLSIAWSNMSSKSTSLCC